MVFDPDITLWFRDALPWAGEFFRIITELGGELFYIALILTGFWAFKKRGSLVTAFVLIFSLLSNYWLKTLIANPRPPESYWYEGYEAANYSTPSGHAQNSATLFGWFAIKIRTSWMILLSIILTILIGLSRVYLGVHYFGDVLLGWSIGFATVLVLGYFEEPIRRKMGEYNELYFYVFLVIIAVAGLLISSFLFDLPPGDNFGSYAGLLIGLAVALPLEKQYVDFDVEVADGKKWKLVLRVILGLIIVISVMMGLSPIMPTEDVLLRTLRYALAVITGIFIWPFIFKRANL